MLDRILAGLTGAPCRPKAGTFPKGHIGMRFRCGTFKAVWSNPEGLPTKFSLFNFRERVSKRKQIKADHWGLRMPNRLMSYSTSKERSGGCPPDSGHMGEDSSHYYQFSWPQDPGAGLCLLDPSCSAPQKEEIVLLASANPES